MRLKSLLSFLVAAVLTFTLAPTAVSAPQSTPSAPLSTPVSAPLAAAAGDVAVAANAPSQVAVGTTAWVTVTSPVSLDATSYLEVRSGGTWKRTATKVIVVDGYGTGRWAPKSSATYRVAGGGIESESFTVNVTKASGTAVSLVVPTHQARSLEMLWLQAKVVKAGKAAKSHSVAFERAADPDGTWTRLGKRNTNASGAASLRVRSSSTAYYRAVALNSKGTVVATSAPFNVVQIGGDVTLTERRLSLSWYLGKAKTGIKKISAKDVKAAKYTGGATSARYQEFAKGTLVEVRQAGKIRTWLVFGNFAKEYKAQKRWKGKLGLPERDVRCGLPEGGCVQLFSRGAVYTKTSRGNKRYVAYGQTVQVEIAAAARSQTGYKEPKVRHSKYNTWIGGHNAWCEVFVMWSANAAGHKGKVPHIDHFPTYIKRAKASPGFISKPKASQLRAGDVLLFNWGSGQPTHTAIVLRAKGKYVYTVEGNTTSGTGSAKRGVFERQRLISHIWGSFRPTSYSE